MAQVYDPKSIDEEEKLITSLNVAINNMELSLGVARSYRSTGPSSVISAGYGVIEANLTDSIRNLKYQLGLAEKRLEALPKFPTPLQVIKRGPVVRTTVFSISED